ncbi:MAG: Fic family protein [Verrucomicrobiota bacterium]|nr:Fic family protein [Verrucomicrobiota bacterium]
MKTIKQFQSPDFSIPLQINWQLSDLAEFKGKQELFTHQAPQKLQALREHALIESAVSSNRIEGVEVDRSRIATVVFGAPVYNDRNEEEVAGYRTALNELHNRKLPVTEKNMLQLHQWCRGDIWDAGQYKDKPIDILEILPNGEQKVRFRSVSPEESPAMTQQLFTTFEDELKNQRIPPLLLLGALNLDFLCIHPFRDGNGRVSRLLLLQCCYMLGFEVGRYISLERIIEQNKERYYETLRQSSEDWHEGRHNPWLYIGYLLFILKQAYKEFEQRVGEISAPHGEKTARIEKAIQNFSDQFSTADLHAACPGVGIDLVRATLKRLQEEKEVKCLGKGRSAKWIRLN